ncbi:MAG: adenosylhomocysteinase [Candidatus Diapherotrites archaeon]
MSKTDYDVKDISLHEKGMLKIEWAERQMPVLQLIRKRFEKEKPLKGIRIGACLHVTTETANLVRVLKEGGAEVRLCASNPLSTQDDVAAAIAEDLKINVYAIKGEDNNTYYKHLNSVLDLKPQITMDDGGDLVSEIHSKRTECLKEIIGGTEETTTGVIRFKNMERDGVLKYPIIAVNNAQTKFMFDNRYGTGQSTIDGILRATNILLAGRNVVIAGYGWCGRGLALKMKGMGANVTVTEVDHLKGLEALMDGFKVERMEEAARNADLIVTLTGDINVVDKRHFELLKDGCILANSGHFNVEINIPELAAISKSRRIIRDFVEEFALKDGKKVYVLGEGRLINLAAAEGHPAAVMDMSFANQALSVEFMKENKEKLKNKVYDVPKEIDERIARLKLESMNVGIDELTEEQKKYLTSWEQGT